MRGIGLSRWHGFLSRTLDGLPFRLARAPRPSEAPPRGGAVRSRGGESPPLLPPSPRRSPAAHSWGAARSTRRPPHRRGRPTASVRIAAKNSGAAPKSVRHPADDRRYAAKGGGPCPMGARACAASRCGGAAHRGSGVRRPFDGAEEHANTVDTERNTEVQSEAGVWKRLERRGRGGRGVCVRRTSALHTRSCSTLHTFSFCSVSLHIPQ